MEGMNEADPLWNDLLQVRKAGERAETLTRQLLAFCSKQPIEPRAVDLNQIIQDLDEMLLRLIGEDINLNPVLASDIWLVKVDPGLLEQVIINLVVNARDAMRAGGTITVKTGNVELEPVEAAPYGDISPGQYVLLKIADTGCGMDDATIKRIFEPFFTTQATGKGTGLGLAMVYGIIKQSGGGIRVASGPGRGTSF